MAWRDTRTSRGRLLLYTASITLGIAALVSIASFGQSLRQSVREQSVGLLGADLVASSRQPFNAEAEKFFQSLGGRQARELQFSSMVLFPRTGQARLVSVRAVEDDVPFYGTLETEPAGAARSFRNRPAVLVEDSLLLQFGAQVGDSLKLGDATLEIAGAVRKVPGESPGFSLIAARVYLPMRFLASTGLVQRGSRVTHRVYFALPPGTDTERIRDENHDRLRDWEIWVETVGSRQVSLGRVVENMEGFLGLVGFVALLLGAVGVASGVHVFIRQKIASIAVLRCVGATIRQTFLVYLVQAVALGLAGAAAGAALGVAIQFALPRLLAGVLPVEVRLAVSWTAVIQGILAGVGVTLALALLPLLGVRRVSPLLAIRSSVESARGSWRDPATLLVVACGLIAILAFAIQQAPGKRFGVAFVAGTAIVFGALCGLGWLLMRVVRRMLPARAPYVWRQGLANLFRPNNRTLLVILALGLGTFLIVTMQLTQGMLVNQIELSRSGHRSNMVLFDIQSDQRADVRALLEEQGLRVSDDAPMVTMRIASVRGRTIEALRSDPQVHIPPWILAREYRSTYRRELTDSEKLLRGTWIGEAPAGASLVPISLEEEIAGDLRVSVGDRMDFDVQGAPVQCEVASIRAVDWRRVQPNFFVVFPAGVLEDAPQFAIMATHVETSAQSAQVQRAVFERFPNVSVIDLTLVLQAIDAVIEKMRFVFQFMATFIVGTGLVVLGGVMASGRFQRLRESVLLRTIGASRAQIARIQLVEYWLLGTLASLAGVLLAWVASWALGRWMFELTVLPAVRPMLVAWAVVSGLTIVTGSLAGRRVLSHPPLEVLRQET